jgi:hypothetical protein
LIGGAKKGTVVAINSFHQIGWFCPASRRFQYTDEQEYNIKNGRGQNGYTVPVYAIDPVTAGHLQITLEAPQKKVEAVGTDVQQPHERKP